MDKPHDLPDIFGDAMMWYLQLGVQLLDKLGADSTAARLSTAIDCFAIERTEMETVSDDQISREEHVRTVLEMFARNRPGGTQGNLEG